MDNLKSLTVDALRGGIEAGSGTLRDENSTANLCLLSVVSARDAE